MHIRQYSLSDAPGRPYYRISVKREDAIGDLPSGKVSVYLHEAVKEGDVLWLSAPAGAFTLERRDARPVVLLSGGVGLTPMVSMLKTLAETEPDRRVTFVHAAQNGELHALKSEVERIVEQSSQRSAYWVYDRPSEGDRAAQAFHKEGYVDLPWLQSIVPAKDASFYFCGPVPFMKAMNAALKEWGVPESDIHYEFFGPAGSLES